MRVERKKQQKLSALAKMLDDDGRHVEAHVVRVVVKPYIRGLNLGWQDMGVLDKFKFACKQA